MKCAEAVTFMHSYVDGELASVDRESYERHMQDCPDCLRAWRLQARFKAAVRGHLFRRSVPAGLEEKILAALPATPPGGRRWPWQAYPRFMPAAAAAVLLLTIMVTARGRTSAVLDQALRTFHASMPMDVANSDCSLIGSWFRGKLDFTVQPQTMGKLATCQGGRLVNVGRDRLGAYLWYQAPSGHRLGVMVLDADDEPIVAPRHRVLDGRDVYFMGGRGAWSAAYRGRDGLYYVVTADLDEDSLSGFLEAAFHGNR